MPRIRSIKPEFFCSPQIAECSPTARLLFVGLWCFADDRGVHPADPRRVKLSIFPGDVFSVEEISGWVAELTKAGLLGEFTADDDKTYWFVTGWSKHQKIEKASFKYPCPPEFDDQSPNGRRTVGDYSPNSSRTPPPGAEESGEERKGRERSGGEQTSDSVFFALTSADLSNSDRLHKWFTFASHGQRAVVDPSDDGLLFVFAAAEEALANGKKPEKLFGHLVGRARGDPKVRESIKPEAFERARKRIAQLNRNKNHPNKD